MQIHEITARKRINEASMLSGLGSALANKFVSSTLGVSPDQTSGGGQGQGTDARARGAMQVNQQAATLLGQQLGKAWAVAVQEFMKNHRDGAGNPLTNMRNANPGDADRLKQELSKMIMNSTKIRGTLDAWVAGIDTGDVSDKQEAKLIADNIKQLENAIWKETVDPSDAKGQARAQAFTNLGIAIAQAQNVNTFTRQEPATSTPGSPRVEYDARTGAITVDGRPYDPTNTAQRAAVEEFFRTR